MDAEHCFRFHAAMRQFFPEILDKILPSLIYFEVEEGRSVREYSDGSRNVTTSFLWS